jgi:D-alanyl-D-alanine dipeptidase
MTKHLYFYCLFLGILSLLSSCKTKSPVTYGEYNINRSLDIIDKEKPTSATDLHDSVFVDIKDYSSKFLFDFRYATTNNFLKQKVYECEKCLLRYGTLKKLLAAQKDFEELGYKVILFDCYRPHDVQKKMWAIFPNASYVADPAKGSIHNRGGAIDLTLANQKGEELDMGSAFDHFGEESHHAYDNLSFDVKQRRKTLKNIMEKHGLKGIAKEWWHYQDDVSPYHKISNFSWGCE